MPSTAISTLSLHDALPILGGAAEVPVRLVLEAARIDGRTKIARPLPARPSIRDQLRIVELDAGERETPGPIVTQVDRVRRHAGGSQGRADFAHRIGRSEERRVGKECRSRW